MSVRQPQATSSKHSFFDQKPFQIRLFPLLLGESDLDDLDVISSVGVRNSQRLARGVKVRVSNASVDVIAFLARGSSINSDIGGPGALKSRSRSENNVGAGYIERKT